jgi:aryl-alcohol dehydrogenase-like predicted oxidoreductase
VRTPAYGHGIGACGRIGSAHPEAHLEENVAAASLRLSDEQIARLTAAAGPGTA